jgi:hypothetical protein
MLELDTFGGMGRLGSVLTLLVLALQCLLVRLQRHRRPVRAHRELEDADKSREQGRVCEHIAGEVSLDALDALTAANSSSSCRAFADYVFGSLLLHFFCVNFIN